MPDNGPPQPVAARSVDAARAIEWFVSGWNTFMRNPAIWMAITVILFVVLLVLSMIPLLGQLAVLILLPIAAGGLMLGCKALHDGEALRVDHLLEGLRRCGGPLAVVGVLYAVGGLLSLGVGLLAGAGGAIGAAITQGWPGVGMASGGFALGALIYLAISALLAMAVWFAPALVALHGLAPIDAMQASLVACLRNFVPFLVFGILAAIGGFFAMLPAGLGLLVYAPVLAGAAYASYLDVFG